MTQRHSWHKTFDEKDQVEVKRAERLKMKRVKTDFDGSRTVFCCCCGRTCTKMEIMAHSPGELTWHRLADGWACPKCYRPIEAKPLEEGAANG